MNIAIGIMVVLIIVMLIVILACMILQLRSQVVDIDLFIDNSIRARLSLSIRVKKTQLIRRYFNSGTSPLDSHELKLCRRIRDVLAEYIPIFDGSPPPHDVE